MPILSNTRRELFAQEIAKGRTITEAYVVAGYKDNDSNASKMANHPEIVARVTEITGKAAIRAEISVAQFTTDLQRLASKAEKLADEQSNSTGYAVAKACVMDAAKLNGLVIDRSERGNPGEFADIESMDADQLRAFVARPAPSLDDQDETRH